MMAAQSLSSGFPLQSLLDGLVDITLPPGIEVTGVATDSRKVKAGDLFIGCAVGGQSNIPYIDDAINAGASVILAEDRALSAGYPCSVPLVRAKDLYKKIGPIADRLYRHPSAAMTVTGVTGTNGKTTVSHLLAQSLSAAGEICGLIGTMGYGRVDQLAPGLHTTPEPLVLQALLAEMRDRKMHQVVMEVSSHGIDQHRIAGVKFDLAIFTNLSRDHLDYHQTMQDYAAAKRRLFTDYGIKKRIINRDDEFGRSLIRESGNDGHTIACTLDVDAVNATENSNDLVLGRVIDMQPGKMVMSVKSPWGAGDLVTRLYGEFNARNLLAVLSALCLLGYSFDEALARLSRCRTIPGRMETLGNENTSRVVIDYAHTPDALEQVLSTLRSICAGELYCVFGCGGDRDQGKRSLMGAIAEKYADHIILTSDNPRYEDPEKILRDIFAGISSRRNVAMEIDRDSAIRAAIGKAVKNDIVLIAGKGHETYQEIAGVRRPFSDQGIVRKALGMSA